MKSNVFPVAAIGLCLASGAQLSPQMAAQTAAPMQEAAPAPNVLMVVREQIKEGREAAQPFDQPTPVDAINAALVDEIFYSPFQ